jgi:hypothetical protein
MKKLLLFMTILLLLFTGCSNSDTKKSGYELDSYNGGNVGVEFNFAENMPPEKIRDNGATPFNIRITAENKGEYDVPENEIFVSLTGFNPSDFNLNDASKPMQALRGVSKRNNEVVPGGFSQVIFNNLKYSPSIVSGSIPINLFANICYKYQTRSTALICIKGDTYSTIDENNEICSIDGDKKYANSGAPVSIENVKEYPYGENSIQIQFDIVHKPLSQNSQIFEEGSLDNKCNIEGKSITSSEAIYKKDKIKYTVETGLDGLNCEGTNSNSNMITLSNNKYTVTCIQDTTGEVEYEKPIFITLDYDYFDRKSKSITIEHVDVK